MVARVVCESASTRPVLSPLEPRSLSLYSYYTAFFLSTNMQHELERRPPINMPQKEQETKGSATSKKEAYIHEK